MTYSDFFTCSSTGKLFTCHKVFLAESSPVFKAMIESGMQETKKLCLDIECSEEVCENLIKFIYTEKMDEVILRVNAVSFLNLGEKYDIVQLKVAVEECMVGCMNLSNMLQYFLAGDLYKGEKIRAAAKIFLRRNWKSVVEQEWVERSFQGPI